MALEKKRIRDPHSAIRRPHSAFRDPPTTDGAKKIDDLHREERPPIPRTGLDRTKVT
jgi:hypothetical protein